MSRPGRVHLTRVVRFNAGHRLFHPDRDETWNRRVFGKCSYPGGHGHNYTLWLTVSGRPCPETGFVVELEALDALIERHLMEWIDHRNLNDVLSLEAGPAPTTEVLIVEIWDRLTGPIAELARQGRRSTGARLERLRISETSKNTFEYAGPRRAEGNPRTGSG